MGSTSIFCLQYLVKFSTTLLGVKVTLFLDQRIHVLVWIFNQRFKTKKDSQTRGYENKTFHTA
jgi:hypothetical protein